MSETEGPKGEERDLELNEETIADLEVRERVYEIRRLIGAVPSAANCPSIDRRTCLCRTHKPSCTCPPPVDSRKIVCFVLGVGEAAQERGPESS